MNFYFLTIFPGMIDAYAQESIMKKASDKGLLHIEAIDIRAFSDDRHNKVDDSPYGGGPGMVMKALPIVKAYKHAEEKILAKNPAAKIGIMYMTPRGETFTQEVAKTWATNFTDLVFMCGRYEGMDYRSVEILHPMHVSLGDFVVTGGEMPALIMMDTVSRLVPGVLGNGESLEFTRNASEKFYTKPESIEWEGVTYAVPEVLLSGHHENIEKWRAEN